MDAIPSRDNWNLHWDRYAAMTERNPAPRYRRTLILELLAEDSGAQPPRVLDLGSGPGDFAAAVAQACPRAEVLGLELSASGVEIAGRKVPRAHFVECDLLAPQSPPEPWRAWATHAVCSEVLEHVDQPERLLENARAWMAPGCKLIVTVPGGPMSAFDRHLGHRRHYRPEELRRLLERAGFRVREAHGAGFPFFNLYRRVVVARGTRVIEDSARPFTPAAALALRAFDALFRFNLRSHGWQCVAVAYA